MRLGRFTFRYILFFEILTGLSWLYLAYAQAQDSLTYSRDEWAGVVICCCLACGAFFVAWSLFRGKLWAVVGSWFLGLALTGIGAAAVLSYFSRRNTVEEATINTLVMGWSILLPAAAGVIFLSMPSTGKYFARMKQRRSVVRL